jgi:gliding motility-associated-like protein
VYNDTIPNSVGCDSVIVIDLTVNVETFAEITDTACFKYKSPSGQWIESSGTYVDTIQNIKSCDSIITINLTIKTVDVTVSKTSTTLTAEAADASFQWLVCDNYTIEIGEEQNSITPTVGGGYAAEVSQNGCIDTTECNFISLLDHAPSAFTPNNDGVNDLFILNIKYTENTVTIFNRWGDIVIELKNYDDSNVVWDGNDVDGEPVIGTFFYVIEAEESSSGWVHIVR